MCYYFPAWCFSPSFLCAVSLAVIIFLRSLVWLEHFQGYVATLHSGMKNKCALQIKRSLPPFLLLCFIEEAQPRFATVTQANNHLVRTDDLSLLTLCSLIVEEDFSNYMHHKICSWKRTKKALIVPIQSDGLKALWCIRFTIFGGQNLYGIKWHWAIALWREEWIIF